MIQNWEFLNSNREIFESLKEQWQSMLDDKTLKEEDYHQFLSEHAGVFFSHISNCFTCISKLNLGDDFQTDFVVPRDSGSYGFMYELIEIESPHTPAFNKNSSVSSRLNRAIQQVSDWEHWIRQNQETAKRLFPSKSFYLQGASTLCSLINQRTIEHDNRHSNLLSSVYFVGLAHRIHSA